VLTHGVMRDTRAGKVREVPWPVMSVYDRPTERVLFHPERDANPFFHLFEAIWMLAGQSNGRFLDQFVGDFTFRFAEPESDGELHGSYGHRWRNFFERDQLLEIARILRDNPADRRVVLQMWDARSDLGVSARDIPCNTQVYFRMIGTRLDMTIMCRSNDAVWGAYGANAVHFSVLHEWMAAAVNADVGMMYQFSNNLHGYIDTLPERHTRSPDMYVTDECAPRPMVKEAVSFLRECEEFVEWNGAMTPQPKLCNFLDGTAKTALWAHRAWKQRDLKLCMFMLSKVQARDWRIAMRQWIDRRIQK